MDLTNPYNPDQMKNLTDERAIIGHLKQYGVSDPDQVYLHKQSMTQAARRYRNYGWLFLLMTPVFLLLLIIPGLFTFGLSVYCFLKSGKQRRVIDAAFERYEKELQEA